MRKPIFAIICIALILAAIAASTIIVKLAPKAEKKRPPKMAALVKTRTLEARNQVVTLKLTGTVQPAEEIKLQARVSGEVVFMSPDFIDGGLFKKGDDILKIDPLDYELALAEAESKLENARFSYKTELGRQEVAKHEWELLKTDDATELQKELALRKPHLAADKAALAAAEAGLKKAEVNLRRTEIRAPFNAVVSERSVHIGSQATLQAGLGMLVGTDAYWVLVSIPVDRLQWVTVPGSSVRIISSSGAEREGTVIKLLGNLEEKGRMARLLVEVKDPLCIQPEHAALKPLLLSEFVRVEIHGRELSQVYTIPRNALRENSVVWIANDGMLDIRSVDVLWRDANRVIIRNGLNDGENLIISDLTAPIQGMDVNTGQENPAQETKPEAQK